MTRALQKSRARSCRWMTTNRLLPTINSPGEVEMNLFDLTGHVAIVTGGNGGIGLGMAKGLVGAGAKVVIAGRNAAKAEGALTELETLGGNVAFIEGDVRDEATCARIISDTVARFGRLDILVNNAGAH